MRVREMTTPPTFDIPASGIDEVIARMQFLDARLPRGDGFWWFNKLYLRMTLAIGEALRGGQFHDLSFVVAWDIGFAQLYSVAKQDFSTGLVRWAAVIHP
jgi:hypothetical protein